MYEVVELDLDRGICLLKPSQSEYFTIPVIDTRIIDYTSPRRLATRTFSANYGSLDLEISINTFQKKRWMTNELLGVGQIDLPPQNLHTTVFGWDFAQVDRFLATNHLWGVTPTSTVRIGSVYAKNSVARQYTCRACVILSNHLNYTCIMFSHSEPSLTRQSQTRRPTWSRSVQPVTIKRRSV